MPETGITLHGGIWEDDQDRGTSSAILFKLDHDQLQEVREAWSGQGALQFIGGRVPKIRLGKRSIDLTISDEAFRHELYSASLDTVQDLHFAGLVSHRAEFKSAERKQSVGSDHALAALQSTLATFKREKQANSTNITSSVLPAPRNRFEAARKQKQDARRGILSQVDLVASSDSRHLPSGPSPPTSADEFAARQQAMRTPLMHLLAMRPMSRESIIAKTHIPKDSLDDLLQRFGKQVDGKWQLAEKAYKQLDVWKFSYPSQRDRQAAIDNAIRAFDRSRLGKDEKEWQMLYPENERGKGNNLSRLHLTGTAGPSLSPNPHPEGGAEGKASTANTPRLGPANTTPNLALNKRLFAKDPQKARATTDAKEKKRKERETVASDKEGSSKPPAKKRQITKPTNSKIKSAAIVHSSEDESGEEGEVKETKPIVQPKVPVASRKTINNVAAKPVVKPVPSTKSSDSSDGPMIEARPAIAKKAPLPAKPTPASSARPTKPAAVKKAANGTPATSSQARTQLSPKSRSTKPKVPSPLGPARPRVASDVSDRAAVSVQRPKSGAETPKGLGITTNGVRKRQDTVTSSTESITSTGSDKMKRDTKTSTVEKSHKPAVNGVGHKRVPSTNGNVIKAETGNLKRKPAETTNEVQPPAAKHRRIESESSSKQHHDHPAPPSKTRTTLQEILSISGGSRKNDSNDKSAAIFNNIQYSQGVTLAQRFRTYYPKYIEIYDAQAAVEQRGDKVPREDREMLWEMHRRLAEMKMHMKAASHREHLED